MMDIEWKDLNKKYVSGEDLFINGIRVGGYFYNSSRPKDDPLAFRINTRLPGFTIKTIDFEKSEDAKKKLEDFTKKWIRDISE